MNVAEERNSSFLAPLDFSAVCDTVDQTPLLPTLDSTTLMFFFPTSLTAQPQAQGLAHSGHSTNILNIQCFLVSFPLTSIFIQYLKIIIPTQVSISSHLPLYDTCSSWVIPPTPMALAYTCIFMTSKCIFLSVLKTPYF